MQDKDKTRCSICRKPYTGFGNNALPLQEKRCCDVCNRVYVVPARLMRLYEQTKVFKREQEKDQ